MALRSLLYITVLCLLNIKADAIFKPNIIFILADDLGYNEMGFMNHTRGLLTPNLDGLASDGVILNNYYVQPICSPTRSALMTGKSPMRLGTQSNVIYWDTPWAVPLENKFMPEYLKEEGYNTALFGKWHLGMFKEEYTPWKRGFDEHMGYLQGCESSWTHVASCCSAENPTSDQNYVCPAGKKDYRGYDWFKAGKPDFTVNGTNSADLIRQAAVSFLKRQSKTEPFFLYLPLQNIHAPYDCEKRFKDLYTSAEGLTDEEKTMFGYISEMDNVVGSVIHTLHGQGLYNNSVIIFSSDNGAPNAPSVNNRNYPLKGFKTQIWEGGVKDFDPTLSKPLKASQSLSKPLNASQSLSKPPLDLTSNSNSRYQVLSTPRTFLLRGVAPSVRLFSMLRTGSRPSQVWPVA